MSKPRMFKCDQCSEKTTGLANGADDGRPSLPEGWQSTPDYDSPSGGTHWRVACPSHRVRA